MKTYNILIIEDDEIDRISYIRAFMSTDYKGLFNFYEANCAKDALPMIENIDLHCILLDFHLPDSTGDEVVGWIKAMDITKKTPIILLTGQGSEKIAMNALKQGVKDYMIKGELSDTKLVETVFTTIQLYETELNLRRENERNKYEAAHDHLTGLSNRNQFESYARKLISTCKRHARNFALMYVDLNDFKLINDNFGHTIGDELLVQISRRLESNVRNEDLVARLGGDEFGILITEMDSNEKISIITNKIRAALSEPYHVKDWELNMKSSIGVACFQTECGTYESLLERADRAMYQAKKSDTKNIPTFDSIACNNNRKPLN